MLDYNYLAATLSLKYIIETYFFPSSNIFEQIIARGIEHFFIHCKIVKLRFTMSNTVVQYVLLRSDLLKDLSWSIGALVAQACHAATAVLHLYKDDEQTIQYLNDLDNMHKVVLEVPNEESLKKVAEKLKENNIAHKLWIEQPENIPTCLALKPYPKDEVKKFVGKFKLYKDTLESSKQ